MIHISDCMQYLHMRKSWQLLCLTFLSFGLVSCSNSSGMRSYLDAAYNSFINGEYDASQAELLKAESLITEDTPLSDKEYLERLKGMNYYELRVMDKAHSSVQRALDYSTQLGDTSLIIQNSFNLGLCTDNIDEFIGLYRNIISLADNKEAVMLPQALEKLAQAYIYINDFKNAQATLDKACELLGDNSWMSTQLAFTQCELWAAEDSLEMALAGFKSIPIDSCSIDGKFIRSKHIYEILYELGDYKEALAYKDSVQQFTDSIKSIDGANRVQRIEEAYIQNSKKERTRFNSLLYSSLGAFFVIAIIMFFVLKNLRLKRRQVALTNRIAELNIKLSELQPKENQEEHPVESIDSDNIHDLIMEKFSLSMEMLKIQPQYELLKKLNLIRDFDTENRQEIKNLYSEIIGRFSDACSSLRQTVPIMTNDDCLLCTLSYCGCSKEVVSAIMGASEEAVRRRKSRVKQKLPESLFLFFFK